MVLVVAGSYRTNTVLSSWFVCQIRWHVVDNGGNKQSM